MEIAKTRIPTKTKIHHGISILKEILFLYLFISYCAIRLGITTFFTYFIKKNNGCDVANDLLNVDFYN